MRIVRIDGKLASAYTDDAIWLMLRMGQTLDGLPLTYEQFRVLRKTLEHRKLLELMEEVAQP